MSTSLGFRNGCDHIAERYVPHKTVLDISNAEADVPIRKWCRSCGVRVPHGIVALLLYSGLFVTLPLLYHYVEYDYTSDVTRGTVIGLSGVVALSVVLANSYAAWFNMALFFHIGLEVKALDKIMEYAMQDGRSTEGMALAWTAYTVIIVHLVPFLLFDRPSLLMLLAFAGVMVNASALVFIDPDQLINVGFSSTTLLGATVCIAARCGVSTSLLTCLRESLGNKMLLGCTAYEA